MSRIFVQGFIIVINHAYATLQNMLKLLDYFDSFENSMLIDVGLISSRSFNQCIISLRFLLNFRLLLTDSRRFFEQIMSHYRTQSWCGCLTIVMSIFLIMLMMIVIIVRGQELIFEQRLMKTILELLQFRVHQFSRVLNLICTSTMLILCCFGPFVFLFLYFRVLTIVIWSCIYLFLANLHIDDS